MGRVRGTVVRHRHVLRQHRAGCALALRRHLPARTRARRSPPARLPVPLNTMRALLVAGLLAGLIGGVFAFGFAAVVGEPPVEVAISIEESGDEHPHSHGDEEAAEVSRGVQSTLGLAIATVAFGAALGGLFSFAFAFVYGRTATT